MTDKRYEFEAVIEPVPDKGGAFVRFPHDIRKDFGVGRAKASISFDGEAYMGSIVNMGLKNADGSICYIIGVRKDIRSKIGKQAGDTVNVTVEIQSEQRKWICPKCGRRFANTNQDHYCGKAPKTVEEYILRQPKEVQHLLRELDKTICSAIPEAVSTISWSMPTYKKGVKLIQFAAFKKHIGLYPGSEAVETFMEKLVDYQISKGTIRLPLDQPLPLPLVAEIAKWCERKYRKI